MQFLISKNAIDAVINNDEGGWVLTANENDPDGSWTYAGVTRNTFVKFNSSYQVYNYAAMKSYLDQPERLQNIQQDVYNIYKNFYCDKLMLDQISFTLKTPLLSFAVNCGITPAIEALQQAVGVKVDWIIGKDTILTLSQKSDNLHYRKFLNLWRQHYAQIVLNNAKLWKLYSVDKTCPMPTMAAANLSGWLNRVARYDY